MGLTLLELIVVIVILGILSAIAIPTFLSVIGKSKYSSLETTAHSLGTDAVALAAYSSSPPTAGDSTATDLARITTPSTVTLPAAPTYVEVAAYSDVPAIEKGIVKLTAASTTTYTLAQGSVKVCLNVPTVAGGAVKVRVGACGATDGAAGTTPPPTTTTTTTPAPTLSGISPTSGNVTGGTKVTLTGANFASGDTVMFRIPSVGTKTVYGANTNASGPSSAERLESGTTAARTFYAHNGLPGSNTTSWVQLGLGTNASGSVTTLPAPNGDGALLSTGTFPTNLPAGTWSTSLQIMCDCTASGDSMTLGKVKARFYKYNGGSYAEIGTLTVSVAASVLYGTWKTVVLSGPMPAVSFGGSTALYMDVWAQAGGPGADQVYVMEGSTNLAVTFPGSVATTFSKATSVSVVSPSEITAYTPSASASGAATVSVIPATGATSNAETFTYDAPVTLYVTTSTIGSAAVMSTTSQGSATKRQTRSHLPGGHTYWIQLPFGTSVLSSNTGTNTSGPPSPNGDGAVFSSSALAQGLLGGTYRATIHLTTSPITSNAAGNRLRFWKKNGSSYTLIGYLTAPVSSFSGTAVYTFTGTLPASSFGAGTELYVTLCVQGGSGTTTVYTWVGSSQDAITLPGFG